MRKVKSNIFNDFQIKVIDKGLSRLNILHVLRSRYEFRKSTFAIFFKHNEKIFVCECVYKHDDRIEDNVDIQRLIGLIEKSVNAKVEKLDKFVFLTSSCDKSEVRENAINLAEVVVRDLEIYCKFKEFYKVNNTKSKYNPVDKAEIFLDRDKDGCNSYMSVLNIFGIREESIHKFIEKQIQISKEMTKKINR